MKLSVSILEADSVYLCHLQLDRIRSIYGHKQISMTSYLMEIAKYLVYFHFALDRQKKVSLIVLRIMQLKSPYYYMLR